MCLVPWTPACHQRNLMVAQLCQRYNDIFHDARGNARLQHCGKQPQVEISQHFVVPAQPCLSHLHIGLGGYFPKHTVAVTECVDALVCRQPSSSCSYQLSAPRNSRTRGINIYETSMPLISKNRWARFVESLRLGVPRPSKFPEEQWKS